MFIHMQMAKEKQNLLLVTFENKMDKARFECYLLIYIILFSFRKFIPTCMFRFDVFIKQYLPKILDILIPKHWFYLYHSVLASEIHSYVHVLFW